MKDWKLKKIYKTISLKLLLRKERAFFRKICPLSGYVWAFGTFGLINKKMLENELFCTGVLESWCWPLYLFVEKVNVHDLILQSVVLSFHFIDFFLPTMFWQKLSSMQCLVVRLCYFFDIVLFINLIVIVWVNVKYDGLIEV